jgi:hypothetical protein
MASTTEIKPLTMMASLLATISIVVGFSSDRWATSQTLL